MNERTHELRNQAQKWVLDIPASLSPAEFDDMFEEKFAELIVRECIAQARKEEDRFCALGHSDLGLAMENYQELLKNHFGVEE
jgi:hypothetical protein